MKIVFMPKEFVYDEIFSHLHDAEKQDIINEVNAKRSIVVSLCDEKEVKLGAVLDFKSYGIHVREVAGKHILRSIRPLEIFAFACAKLNGSKKVTFCTAKDGIKWIGEKLGYNLNHNNEFEKVMN